MPLVEIIYTEGGMIGLYKMTETPEKLEKTYAEIFGTIPPEENFKHFRRKKEWLTTRLLIARLAGPGFSISYTKAGKPNIIHPEYKFISISHSAAYVAVYLNKNKKVGIDIEQLNRNYSAIEKKYLSEEELEHTKQYPELKAIYWSAKEAIFKWADNEGIDFREQISIENYIPGTSQTFYATLKNPDNQMILLQHLLFDEHVLVYTC